MWNVMLSTTWELKMSNQLFTLASWSPWFSTATYSCSAEHAFTIQKQWLKEVAETQAALAHLLSIRGLQVLQFLHVIKKPGQQFNNYLFLDRNLLTSFFSLSKNASNTIYSFCAWQRS